MIVCDTNILSSFARIGELDLLFKLFPKQQFAVPRAVRTEIVAAVNANFKFLESVLELLDAGRVSVIILADEEAQYMLNLPKSLGPGESEAIAICALRGALLLSNDKRVNTYCRTNEITVYDLPSLLHALWKNKEQGHIATESKTNCEGHGKAGRDRNQEQESDFRKIIPSVLLPSAHRI